MVGWCGRVLAFEHIERGGDMAVNVPPLRAITAFKYVKNSRVPAD